MVRKHHKSHHHRGHVHKHSMDAQTPQQQTQPSSSQAGNTSHTSKIITIVILLILLGVAAVVALLKSPQLLQKLPQIKQKSAMKTYTPPKLPANFNMALQNGPYRCPLAVEQCKNTTNYQNGWLFATLSPNTQIFAAFDGNYQAQQIVGQNNGKKELFTIGILINTARGLQAYYIYKQPAKEKPLPPLDVKEGAAIAKASGETLALYQNKSFAFQLIKFGTQYSSTSSLSATSFRQL